MHLVIIGNGITGVTCALTVRRRHPAARITLVSEESAYHFSRPALMYAYLGHLRPQDLKPYEDWFWPENRLELVHARATALDPAHKTVQLSSGASLSYDKLLLATGSRGRRAAWPGQELAGVQDLVTLADLERMTRDTPGVQQAVVVGGGLIGIELAEMLRAKGIAVTLLVREARYWGSVLPPEEAALVHRQLLAHHVRVLYTTELAELLPDAAGRVRAVRTTAGQEIPAQWVGLSIGVEPNLDLARSAGLATERGILVDELLQTSAPDVYAAGDCAQHQLPPPGEAAVEQLWYTGRHQGETVAHTICGQPTPYRRGPWYNSAKFFDLEFQTYGRVPPRCPEGQHSFCWQHPNGHHLLRLNFRQDATLAVTGLNVLGMRQRHDVWDQWLRRETPVTAVLARLAEANFDPEFSRAHEPAIRRAFGQQFPQYPLGEVRRTPGFLARFF